MKLSFAIPKDLDAMQLTEFEKYVSAVVEQPHHHVGVKCPGQEDNILQPLNRFGAVFLLRTSSVLRFQKTWTPCS